MTAVERGEYWVLSWKLVDAMQRAGMTSAQLAEASGVSIVMNHEVLNGRRIPAKSHLARLMDVLEITGQPRRDLLSTRDKLEAQRRKEAKGAMPEQAQHGSVRRPVGAEQAARGRVRRPERTYRTFVPRFGQPDPIRVADAAELQEALRAVHVWGGKPPLRELEKRSDGLLRRSTVSDMLRGRPTVPDYERYLAFLSACGIDSASLDVWVYTWRRLVALKDSDVVPWMGGMNPNSTG